MSMEENLKRLLDQIQQLAHQWRRSEKNIRLMAVSKTRTVEEIQEIQKAGLTLFGENRIKEAAEKFTKISDPPVSLVFIGQLQSNKIRYLSPLFKGVHSVSSLAQAQKLSRHRQTTQSPLEILLQVNCSREASKSGFLEKEAMVDAAGAIQELPFLSLKGLMTMAPFVDDEKTVRNCFAACRSWGESLNSQYPELRALELSMGMSSDYPWAIAEGSTLLRIGTILFGERL